MKAKTFILASILLAAISCSEFDDTLIWEELRDHEERITNLENLCNTMNSDIKAVQSLMTALKNRDYIKSVTPIIGREDKEIGYKIVFNDSDPIIIYHGTDGKDGEDAPVISIQYLDGRYYWAQTIDGITSWLYDNDGNLVPAEGQDAVTPLMKIDSDGYWIVSYNNGYTYSRLLDEDGNFVRAEGRDGNDGSDAESFFESVEATEDEVILILADGTEIIIPLGGTPLRKAVDLGLSVRWASYNLGATSQTELGGLYFWGDPTGTAGYGFTAPSVTNISGTEYDTARAEWGGTWRLPTKSEQIELVLDCTWTRATINGVSGMKVTGSNGNYIFLPPTGVGFPSDGMSFSREYATSGYFWVGESYIETYGHMAYCFYYDDETWYYNGSWNADFIKMAIRPVK
ncbi:MAG: hypothetical protein IJ394_07270 [Bacteroidales bacterium]|nr:hypothetical protein [Bacteroidales bacterium]